MTVQALPALPTLKLNKEGKPPLPRWRPPPETQLTDLEWQPLRTLDLALLDGTPEEQKLCQEICAQSVQNEGFLLIKNYGIDDEDMQRMFDLANWTLNHGALSEEDKKEYEWDAEGGNWAGYKPAKGWSEKGKEAPDHMEFYNWYNDCWENDKIPPTLRPYQDEIQAYASHMYHEVSRRILVILSRILGLSDDYLWTHIAAKGSAIPGSSYCRFQAVHPVPPNERSTVNSLIQGHTDHGVTTLIPSQPITCLQMLGEDGIWRYVPYIKGTLVANLGDVMEVVTGGNFKATRHRVIKPVEDQAGYERVSLISFNHADRELPMEPIWDSPMIKEKGVQKDSQVYGAFLRAIEAGGKIPNFGEWKKLRNLAIHEVQGATKKVMINGRPHYETNVGGVIVHREI